MKGTNALLTSAMLLAAKRHARTIRENMGGGGLHILRGHELQEALSHFLYKKFHHGTYVKTMNTRMAGQEQSNRVSLLKPVTRTTV